MGRNQKVLDIFILFLFHFISVGIKLIFFIGQQSLVLR